MIKVFSSQNLLDVMFWKQALEQRGLECQVRNEFLGGAAGELPLNECWPELWLLNEDDLPRARRVMDEVNQQNNVPKQDWVCPNCQAVGEPAFQVCWNCGADRPSE